MLETLTIKNFGIIEQVALELSPQLNIMTGETGAGKSILIDALRFCLGERFQSSYLRDDNSPCTVEAVFRLSPKFLEALPCAEDIPADDGALIIQRGVTSDGKNRIRVNGLAMTVAQLKEIGDTLINFHGPHDHQQLLAEHPHLEIIDALTDLKDIRAEYTPLYRDYLQAREKLRHLNELALTRERDVDLLTHQVKELEQVPLDDEAFEALQRDHVKISNAARLHENISLAMDCLDNDETGINTTLSRAFKPLQALARIDEKASEFIDTLNITQEQAAALVSRLKDYADSLSFDPGVAGTINEKFDIYREIQRKYGPALSDARSFYTQAAEKLGLLSDVEHNTGVVRQELEGKEALLSRLAKAISLRRKKTGAILKQTIEKELRELGFRSVLFEARVNPAPLGPSGTDTVTFFISTNAGEAMKPLADIISSGEAARVMLAVKRALMKVDPVPVLIFDEVDAQIGGRLGTVIGTKLNEIATHRQVILITHLPQIAAFAQTHLRISKLVDKGRTRTVVSTITGDDRVNELAHMMAGDTMTATALKHAQEMLRNVGPGAPGHKQGGR